MEVYDNSAKGVFKMSVPIFFELLLQLMVGNMDQIMVSRVSQNSVAAIGNANQVMNIIIIVLNSMSVATTIMISKAMGEMCIRDSLMSLSKNFPLSSEIYNIIMRCISAPLFLQTQLYLLKTFCTYYIMQSDDRNKSISNEDNNIWITKKKII